MNTSNVIPAWRLEERRQAKESTKLSASIRKVWEEAAAKAEIELVGPYMKFPPVPADETWEHITLPPEPAA